MTGSNYTRPDDPNYKDDPKEWLNSALIFAKALGLILKKGEGICLELEGDMYNPFGGPNKVILFNNGDQIQIYSDDTNTELNDGDFVNVTLNESE